MKAGLGLALLWMVLATPPAHAQYGAAGGEWRSYGGGPGSSRYAPLDQIGPWNVHELEVAWRWRSPDNDIAGPTSYAFELTPLMVDGVLYTSTSFGQAAAIDAATGETLWVHDPQAYLSGTPPNNGYLSRGVAYWESGADRRVFLATIDARLIALDALTGEPVVSFGTNGEVDLAAGVPRLQSFTFYGVTSAPTLCDGVVVVGSSIHDGVVLKEAPPGDVRGFDPATGALLWTFHTVPRAGEFGVDTWGDDPVSGVPSWLYSGGANVWAPMSCDETAGTVYLPVSCPTNNYYGGQRPGDNLFGNSIVALDAQTGERAWHFQTVHHDIWDYDVASAPNLMDITVGGVPIPAVAQITKQGFVFVFDRHTGDPVWPIDEVPVAQSAAGNEWTSPTQPMPTQPPPFARQGISIDELIDTSPQIRLEAIDIINQFDWGPLFTPPTERGAILLPGIGGGANWGGASFDPETQILYVTSLGPVPFVIGLSPPGTGNFDLSASSIFVLTGPRGGFNILKPPWGTITAYDMSLGEMLWQVPNSPPNGFQGQASSLVTRTLLFYGNRSDARLRAFDKATGAPVWQRSLRAAATGAPMSYMHGGRQYVVVAIGNGAEEMELVALSLSNAGLPVPMLAPPLLGALALALAATLALLATRRGGRSRSALR